MTDRKAVEVAGGDLAVILDENIHCAEKLQKPILTNQNAGRGGCLGFARMVCVCLCCLKAVVRGVTSRAIPWRTLARECSLPRNKTPLSFVSVSVATVSVSAPGRPRDCGSFQGFLAFHF